MHGLPSSMFDAVWLRSDVARWMRVHHRDLSAYEANGEVDWRQMARAFAEQRAFTGLGDLPSPAFLQDTWQQVEKARTA